ncbi:MAG: outer membrane beta-barrel protein [Candidatus Krumholzibacteriia bacterium]
MSTFRTTTVGIAAALIVLVAGGAAAEPLGNVGGHLAYTKEVDADDGNFLVGAHAELRLLPWLGVQGAVAYRLANTYGFSGFGDGESELKVRSVPVTVTGRLYLIQSEQLRLFGALGAGWYHLIYDYSDDLEALGFDDDSEDTFGWHLGGGVDFPVAESVSVFGEARFVFADADRDLDDQLASQVEDFDWDTLYLMGGLSFHF